MGSLTHQCMLSMHNNPSSASLLPPAASSCGKLRKWALHRAHRSVEGASLKGIRAFPKRSSCKTVVCGLADFVGADLLKFDLGKWLEDVEKYGSVAIYPPAEGGYEGRYATRLKAEGYHFLNLTARGLGDLEAYLTKVHGVRPPHLGKQAVAVYYFPPEVDYRLSLLPKDSKGLVLWLIEAQVLSKSELQYLALLPGLRPKLRVIAECGSWRTFRWKPLREVAGLPISVDQQAKDVQTDRATSLQLQEEQKSSEKVLS